MNCEQKRTEPVPISRVYCFLAPCYIQHTLIQFWIKRWYTFRHLISFLKRPEATHTTHSKNENTGTYTYSKQNNKTTKQQNNKATQEHILEQLNNTQHACGKTEIK